MGPKPYPLRALGVCLRLVLLLGVGPASGAAQATGGFTTAFALATHRTAERQAYLLVSGGGLTFTATSKHRSGRAVEVIVGDGNLKHQRTRAPWIAFRAAQTADLSTGNAPPAQPR
jgi:hypothetical protein